MGKDSFTFCSCTEVKAQLASTKTIHDDTSSRKKAVNVEGHLPILFLDVSTEMNSVAKTILIGIFVFIGSLTNLTRTVQGFTHGGRPFLGTKHVLDCLVPASYSTISGATREVDSELKLWRVPKT